MRSEFLKLKNCPACGGRIDKRNKIIKFCPKNIGNDYESTMYVVKNELKCLTRVLMDDSKSHPDDTVLVLTIDDNELLETYMPSGDHFWFDGDYQDLFLLSNEDLLKKLEIMKVFS